MSGDNHRLLSTDRIDDVRIARTKNKPWLVDESCLFALCGAIVTIPSSVERIFNESQVAQVLRHDRRDIKIIIVIERIISSVRER